MEVEESKKPNHSVVFFKNIGVIVPVYSLKTIRKTYDCELQSCGTVDVYKIVINEGIDTNASGIGELILRFENKEHRDAKFDEIIQMMYDNNYTIHTI